MTRVIRRTARLVLRDFAGEDRARLMQIGSQRAIVDGTISAPDPFDAAAADAWIARHGAGQADAGEHGFAIALAGEPATMIGYVGLHEVDLAHRQAELSFWLDEDHVGGGLATEAAAGLLAYGFDELGLNRVCAFHMVRNQASGQVLRRLGFSLEGVLRQRVFKWGVFEDVNVWSLLRHEQGAARI